MNKGNMCPFFKVLQYWYMERLILVIQVNGLLSPDFSLVFLEWEENFYQAELVFNQH